MPELNSSVSLTTTLPSTKGYTLDTIVTNGSTAEFSQDGKFKLLATSASAYDVSSHQYVTTYGLALTNTSTNSSVTLASGSGTSYAYTSLSNFTVASDIFYIASYMKGGNQLAFRVFDDTGATIIAETVVDSGTKIDSVYYDGLGALVLAYNNNTEYATLSISDPDAPVATHDAATMKQDAMLTVDVLANDTDPNGDELFITSAEVVSGAAEVAVVKGKVTVDHTGTKLWYNETAQVEIRYVISDGTHSSTGNLTVTVTDPFNHITGDETSQRIDGKNGRDYVLAGAGDDHVNGDDASDILFGEDGNDDLFGNDGNDIILGGNGRNTLHGGAGNDTLVGGAVVGNECSGDAGDDTIINGPGGGICAGGEGDDKIYDVAGTGRGLYVGGDGADSFYFFLGSGIDEIKNFDLEDTLKIDVQAAENMQFSRSRGEVSVKFADGSAVDVFFTNWDDAKSDGWYKIGDYKVPTDAHHLY